MDDLPKLTKQHNAVIVSFRGLILLISSTGGPDLPVSPFLLGIPHQPCVETPIPEINTPGYPGPDLLVPADAQHLYKNGVDKDEGSLRVPTPSENPPPFRCQDFREAAPHCS